MYAMVGIDTHVLAGIQDDFDFTQKLLDEESVFVLPGQVRACPRFRWLLQALVWGEPIRCCRVLN